MQKTVLSERMYKILTEHIAEIEREKEPIIKGFFAESAENGMDSEAFFRDYTAQIENYLKNVKVKKEGLDDCPFTIIGCRVELKDGDDPDTFSYRIVLPFAGNSGVSLDSASCFSPMGRALLLKPVGSLVTVKTPSGQMEYEIVSISVEGKLESSKINLYTGKAEVAL
ncbi:MAG: GreA/GreB family elongation factor [Clostridiaceae bacterium]|nr:GreA/GreB family elongation factor [Clostridiaceae bacterium]